MEIHEVRYFLAVCDTLNFTKAAEQCNVTQPALTRAIQKLEGELGGLLFSRERGNTHLTELGRLMQPHLEEVMARTAAAKEQAAASCGWRARICASASCAPSGRCASSASSTASAPTIPGSS